MISSVADSSNFVEMLRYDVFIIVVCVISMSEAEYRVEGVVVFDFEVLAPAQAGSASYP